MNEKGDVGWVRRLDAEIQQLVPLTDGSAGMLATAPPQLKVYDAAGGEADNLDGIDGHTGVRTADIGPGRDPDGDPHLRSAPLLLAA
ncbi:MAG: hypothetical protein OEZ06_31880 [Myxococcales bacterium]|nr:hypothetical protein [Myxococcales bacterium]